jgi:hypothetical protein
LLPAVQVVSVSLKNAKHLTNLKGSQGAKIFPWNSVQWLHY